MRTVDYVSLIKESVGDLKGLENKENNPRLHKRLQLLRILKSGLTPYLNKACAMVGLTEKHGRDLWHKYLAEGFDGYARLNYSRAKRGKLTAAQETAVNEQAGQSGFGSQREVQTFILEQFGVSLAKSNVSKLLQRLEVTAKVPRPRNRRTSESEQAEYKKSILH